MKFQGPLPNTQNRLSPHTLFPSQDGAMFRKDAVLSIGLGTGRNATVASETHFSTYRSITLRYRCSLSPHDWYL